MQKTTIAKIGYVTAAFLSFLMSNYLWFTGRTDEGLYVGIWVPSILAFGGLMLAGRERKSD